MSAEEVIGLMDAEEECVFAAIKAASADLALAARQVAWCVSAGHTVVLLGAGSGGRIALQESAEVPATFGIDRSQFVALVAGRFGVDRIAVTDTEDDEDAAVSAILRAGVGPGDVVIGLAASGRTPFVRAGIQTARSEGAWTCTVINSPNTPLLRDPDLGICLDTGPEVLTGSTRLKAGTAQKLALNRISTAAMVLAGHVASNHMVKLTATNEKLRERAIRIVIDITGLSRASARDALVRTDWSVSDAVKATT